MADNPNFEFTDADYARIGAMMAQSVNETPTAEHVRLAIMITCATNEVLAIIHERLE